MGLRMRKKFIIDWKFQAKYFLYSITLLLSYTVLFAAILFIPPILGLSGGDLPERTEAARAMLNLHQSVWPAIGLVILILSAISFFLTHKIAGPVYRIKKEIAKISAGDLGITIKLRKRDDLRDLAESLNQLVDEMRLLKGTLQDNHQFMAEFVEEYNKQAENEQGSLKIDDQLYRKLLTCKEKTIITLDKFS
ncbi:MAG: hypothetical protein C0616_10990 [Desulfuromonas sp.]|nr:MAG: hypothetical protein C0616_10990 [Desulfuromonas sp.]